MAVDINNKALRGSISQIILNALLEGDKYGYEICKDIEQKTNGSLIMKQPSLYSSLRRMEEQGLISSYWGDSDMGGRRHYYQITEKGKTHYEKNSVNWEDFNQLLNALNPSTPASETISDIKQDITAIKENIDTLEQSNKASQDIVMSGVIKQENLFSFTPPPKVVEEEKPQDSSTNFIQFDMFNQDTSFIKTTETEVPDNISMFTNKYINQDSHNTSIEPMQSSIIKKYDKVSSSDLDNIKTNYNSFFNTKQTQPKTNYGEFDSVGAMSLDSLLDQDFSKLDNISLQPTLEQEEKEEVFIPKQEIEEEVVFIKSSTPALEPEEPENNKVELVEEPTPSKPLEEYDEVLKPHEFIEVQNNNDYVNKYNRPDEFNPIKYSKPTTSYINPVKHKTEEINYKDVLGELYSGTNKKDPYDIKFGEEPTTTATIDEQLVETDKTSNQALFEEKEEYIQPYPTKTTNTLEVVATQFRQEGIKFRTYNKSVYSAKQGDNYINYNKLRMCQGWLVWLFIAIEILITGIVLHRANMLPTQQEVIYYWAFGLSLIYPLVLTIAYFIDPFKKTSSSFKLNINLFNKFLAMLITIVFVFAINLFIGMTSLNQIDFLSYWLLPIILTSNYVISTLLYFILLKTKHFHV